MDSAILTHFQTTDPILASLAQRVELPPLTRPTDYFLELCDAIISQQLSIKASATILSRFKALFPTSPLDPHFLLTLSDEVLRAQGLSFAKIRYVKDLATHILAGSLELGRLDSLSDAAVKQELIAVKGIGEWTAEMFLIFSLHRPDIFSPLDLGLRRAIERAYQLDHEPTRAELDALSAPWSPYRSFASRLLWKSLELKSDL